MREDPGKIQYKKIMKLGSFKNKIVLDVGCGTGTRQYFAPLTKKVVGIDPSTMLIKKAQDQLPDNLKQKVRYQVGSGEELSFNDETFDSVFFSWSLHHIPIKFQKKACRETYRVLKKGGQLLILEPTLKGEFIHFTELSHPEIEPVKNVIAILSELIGKFFELESQATFVIKYYFDNEDEAIKYFRREDNLPPNKDSEVLRLLKSCKRVKNEILIQGGARILSLKKN